MSYFLLESLFLKRKWFEHGGKIEDLEQQVWNEQEQYKNLMFAKESVDEDNYKEIDKLDKELSESKSVIKELKQKIIWTGFFGYE